MIRGSRCRDSRWGFRGVALWRLYTFLKYLLNHNKTWQKRTYKKDLTNKIGSVRFFGISLISLNLIGRHHTNEAGSSFVESICNILEHDQMKRLREHLRLKTQNDQSPTTVPATLLTEWVRNWLEEFGNISVMKLFMDKINCPENTSENESEV